MNPITFLIIMLVFVIAIIICKGVPIFKKEKEKQRRLDAEHRYYDIDWRNTNKAFAAQTYDEAKEALDTMEAHYPGDHAVYHSVAKQVYKENLKDVRQIVKDFKEDEIIMWKRQTECRLDKFYMYYRAAKNIDFSDVEDIKKYTTRCLKYWDEYFSVPLPHDFIDPIEQLRKYNPQEYDPVMNKRPLLETKLDSFIEAATPIKERKQALCKQMRALINPSGIFRSELLRHPFDGYTDQEVKYAYDTMKKTGSIKEEKQGNRWFVTVRKH